MFLRRLLRSILRLRLRDRGNEDCLMCFCVGFFVIARGVFWDWEWVGGIKSLLLTPYGELLKDDLSFLYVYRLLDTWELYEYTEITAAWPWTWSFKGIGRSSDI